MARDSPTPGRGGERLALGVDTAAHQGCLRPWGDGDGHGLWHRRELPEPEPLLRDAIIAGGGVVLSEFPPGGEPSRDLFVKRNRLHRGPLLPPR